MFLLKPVLTPPVKPGNFSSNDFSINYYPISKIFLDIGQSDNNILNSTSNFKLGVDYVYNSHFVNNTSNEYNKKPWFGLGFGIYFSSLTLNHNVAIINNFLDSSVVINNKDSIFRLLVEGKNVSESLKLKSFNVPIFISLGFFKNRNLNFKLGIDLAYLFGSVQSNGNFTYKGVYNIGSIYQDTIDSRYTGIAEKYGFYPNYPLSNTNKLSDLNLLKNINFSFFAEINYKIKISEHADFVLGLNGTFGLRNLLKNKSPENYIISTNIHNYNSLLLQYKKLYISDISLRTGINFKF